MGKNGDEMGDLATAPLDTARTTRRGHRPARVANFKVWSTWLAKWIIRFAYYGACALFAVRKDKITLASYRSARLHGNLRAVCDELRRRNQHHVVVLVRKYQGSLIDKISYVFYMIRAGYHMATSRYFVIDDYYFPVYVVKLRRATEVIQLWHAAGAFKKFGYSIMGSAVGTSADYVQHVPIHSNYSAVIVSSTEVVSHYAEAFRMSPQRILPLGLPRTDKLLNPEMRNQITREFYDAFPNLIGKKLILYAPTFRGESYHQSRFQCPIDMGTLYRMLGDEYRVLVHLHPYMRGIDFTGLGVPADFIRVDMPGVEIEDLMIVSDYLVTDYSSVIFDYSLLLKPMAFFATDLESYVLERDFYYDYKSLIPGPFFTETLDLARWILSGNFQFDVIRRFRDRFFDAVDGRSTQRVLDLFETRA
ncbi:CDP-glycerol glycerophosphotransferase family protein [Alicyclobacillus shizuokensis]|uniref:CDP-glycerol glycerophosphotransferase family protein n=1 Tax=Alicyclobacillus shizuokensis TaxID=392014 RepID=UPI0009FA662D|nr:CDP-glycerol glycerophosphotransferase family protein [Alicyclobacillus shizuokensis]